MYIYEQTVCYFLKQLNLPLLSPGVFMACNSIQFPLYENKNFSYKMNLLLLFINKIQEF